MARPYRPHVNKAGIEKVLDEKNKTLKLNSDSKLELLARLDSLGFDTIIHQSNNVVKGEASDKLYSRSWNVIIGTCLFCHLFVDKKDKACYTHRGG